MEWSKLSKLTFWRAVLVVILAAGFYSTLLRFIKGLGVSTALSDQFPWGLWIGFDVLLVGFMLATAVFGYLRRQVLLFAAFTSGVLLICDAWFDLMTAGPDDVWLSVFTALLIEVPLAIFMIRGAQRIMRLTMMRLWLLDPGVRLWHLPLFP